MMRDPELSRQYLKVKIVKQREKAVLPPSKTALRDIRRLLLQATQIACELDYKRQCKALLSMTSSIELLASIMEDDAVEPMEQVRRLFYPSYVKPKLETTQAINQERKYQQMKNVLVNARSLYRSLEHL